MVPRTVVRLKSLWDSSVFAILPEIWLKNSSPQTSRVWCANPASGSVGRGWLSSFQSWKILDWATTTGWSSPSELSLLLQVEVVPTTLTALVHRACGERGNIITSFSLRGNQPFNERFHSQPFRRHCLFVLMIWGITEYRWAVFLTAAVFSGLLLKSRCRWTLESWNK